MKKAWAISTSHSKTSEHFEDLLRQYTKKPSQRLEIKKEMYQRYSHKKALLITDMSGFTRLTQEYGIIHYLSMIQTMKKITHHVVQSFQGRVIKCEADDCFSIFDTPNQALLAAIKLNKTLAINNQKTSKALAIKIASGIDYGSILLIDNKELFGSAVNIASKLGEDLAHSGEILISKKAFSLLTPLQMKTFNNLKGFNLSSFNISISKIKISAIKMIINIPQSHPLKMK
jgi:class 3 adenylate cyclase